AFGARAVRVPARSECAAWHAHVAQEKLERVEGDVAVVRVAEGDRRLEIEGRELGIVVKHLLEVRDGPGGLRRIAKETSRHVVVNASLVDRVERFAQRVRDRRLAPL